LKLWYLETAETYINGERKALVTFTLRLKSRQRRREGDVSQLVSQFALVSICVRRYRSYNCIIW